MAYPNADIFEIKDGKLKKTLYEQTDHFKITRYFLNCYQNMLKNLGIEIN